MNENYLGKRLSFDQALCTIRYRGLLPGQKGEWLGVEWDEPDRGKHNGSYQGKQIFETLSSSPTCASFIRTTRQADRPRSFLAALRYKYAEEGVDSTVRDFNDVTEISGKVVEEVGFERIRRQQAALHSLKIVVLDGLQIHGGDAQLDATRTSEQIRHTCPNIIELDLSRNLLESWTDVATICAPLNQLRRLKVR